jgi:hypothetical protein
MNENEIAILYEFAAALDQKERRIELLDEWVAKYPDFKQALTDFFHDEVRAVAIGARVPGPEPSESLENIKSTGVSTLMGILMDRDSTKAERA